MGDVFDFVQEEILGDWFGIRPDKPDAPVVDQDAADLDDQRRRRRLLRDAAPIIGSLGIEAPAVETSATDPRPRASPTSMLIEGGL